MVEIETPFPEIKKSRRKIFTAKFLLRAFLYAFAILGVLFIALIYSLIGFLNKDTIPLQPVPVKANLYIDFSNIYNETRVDDILMDVAGVKSISYFDLVNSINQAMYDDRIVMLYADISNVKLGLAQVQDLRKVIKNFRATGKKAIVYSSGFGSFGGGTKSYYLASAFDEIWMQPNAEIGITGISMEVPFFKGLLQKIGVEPEFYTRYEYKNAVASLTSDKFSKEHKKDLTKMANSIFEQIVNDISEDRGIEIKELKKTIDVAPIYIKDAETTKLVDVVDYRPNLIAKINKDTKGHNISLEAYNAHVEKNVKKEKKTIAFLVLDGAINEGYSEASPFGESIIGTYTVLSQLDDILEDKNIKALVVRINSPGGSYTASNEIWYAIKKLKNVKKIPVIVSMSNYAASGGYFIALSGDYIFAENSTITGSIGVLGGKMIFSGMWRKLGINWESINIGKNSGALSLNRKFSQSERVAFNKSLDNVYNDFVEKVSTERKIEMNKMNSLARGRVWTGIEAKENGLVDEIGGVTEALLKAMEMVDSNEKYNIVYYPKKKTIQEKFAELMRGNRKRVEGVKILNEIGIDINDLSMLKRFEYDAILAPFKLSM